MTRKAKAESLFIQEKLFDKNRSQVQKYQDLVIGRSGLLNLVKHELIVLLASWVPGALGLFLRSRLYPLLLGSVGRGVVFGANVVLRHPHKIRLGDDIVIDDNCVLDAKGTDNSGIAIGNGVFVGRNTILYCKNGDIELGDNANISFNCEVFSANFVKVGANVQIAAYSYLNGGTHSIDQLDVPVLKQERSGMGIAVEENAWLGAGVKVLDGVTIGKDAVVGAGAVVAKDVPAFAIAGGVPARVLRMRGEAGGESGDG